MESRGYRPSPTPDLLLDFNGKLEERTDIESTPAPMYGPGWGYGGWYGAPWGGGQEVRTRHYKVGTLVMDIVDRETRQSVYQGGVEGIVSTGDAAEPAGVAHGGRRARARGVPVRRRPVRARRARVRETMSR